MRTVFIAGGLLISLACSSQAQQPGDAAARVGDRTITVAELDERWKSEEPGAKAQAVTPEAFVQAEIGKRTKPVSDTDVRNFYVQNSERMQGRTFEQMSPAIEQYLEDQQQTTAKQDLIAELKKGGPAIRVVMDAPRTTVTVNPDDPSEGKADAAVTLVEYSDFQCPFCLRVMPTLKQLRAKYGDKLRIVWKDFPLTQIHPQAFVAAQAGNCAREQ